MMGSPRKCLLINLLEGKWSRLFLVVVIVVVFFCFC